MTNMPGPDLAIRNVRPMGGPPTTLAIHNGVFVATDAVAKAAIVIDGGGALMMPGLVEAHTHLDKNFLGYPWQPHGGGPHIIDFIENERRLKQSLQLDAATQSTRQVAQSVSFGTTHIRSHVDVDPQVGIRSIEGVMATREAWSNRVDIEIVAFPQWGLLSRPGTTELMEQAMRLGADIVGGLDPSTIDRDPKGHLDVVFDLAARFDRPIDIHLHEPGHLGAFAVREVCKRTRALGMQGRVTLSHAFCLGDADERLVDVLIEDLANSGVAIMTTGPAGWPAPPIRHLLNAGVRICSGNDGIRDAWQPFGDGDMLSRAQAVAQRNEFASDEDLATALSVCTFGGAAVMRLENYGLGIGDMADFVLVEAESIAEAVARPPLARRVFKRGHLVAAGGAR